MQNHLVIFQPSGRRGRVEEGKNLLEVSRELGVDIESVCGGKKTCGKCKVRVQEGFFERHGIESRMGHLSPLASEERKFLTEEELSKGYRLACATQVQGDVLIHVPEESRGGKQVVRKEVTLRKINLNPAVKVYSVKLEKPTLADPLGDYERLAAALKSRHGLANVRAGREILARLPKVLRDGEWEVAAAVWMDREILRVVPGSSMKCFGLAVDIGTTTIAGYLCDLGTGEVVATHSLMNPQVTYGEDVMSRVTYVMTSETGLSELHAEAIHAVNAIVTQVCSKANIRSDDILEMCVVGNTVMHHLFLNITPVGVGVSPFVPAVQSAIDVKAKDLGISVNETANVHVLPNEAGFVGADNVGVLIAEAPYQKEEMQLIIDIGTNGEILMGNRDRLLAASCATGPALEGAHIKFGMRAAPGAVERVTVNPETLKVDYKIIAGEDHQLARGICGSGIIDAIAEMFRAGVIEKSGRINKSLTTPRLIQDGKTREFVLVPKEETAIGRDITITAGDVRAVQLAKGAIYAGAKILMRKLGIEKVDRVVLAGAFGTYIDRTCAMVMGMFPDCPLENVIAVGNAAGDGARMALLDVNKRREAEEQARRVEYVELTLEKEFEREFVEAMHFPHMSDEFPSLEGLLPGR
ncbi:MAG: ASKHA domain-containing protein [Candidatus Abyssubacteria bacterium]